MIKYEKEIVKLLNENLRQFWMNEFDWDEFLEELANDGYTIEKLSNDIEIGISNGYSLEYQLDLCKQAFKQFKL